MAETPPDVRENLRRLYALDGAATNAVENYIHQLHLENAALSEADPFRGWIVHQGQLTARVALLLDRLEQGPLADLAAGYRADRDAVLARMQQQVATQQTWRQVMTPQVVIVFISATLGTSGILTFILRLLLDKQ